MSRTVTATRMRRRPLVVTAATVLPFALPAFFGLALTDAVGSAVEETTGTVEDVVSTDSTTGSVTTTVDETAKVVEETTKTVDETVKVVEETVEEIVDEVDKIVDEVEKAVDDVVEKVEDLVDEPKKAIDKIVDDILPGPDTTSAPDPVDTGDGTTSDDGDAEAEIAPPANPEPDWKNPSWNTPTLIGAESPHGRTFAVAAPRAESWEAAPVVSEAFGGPFVDAELVGRPLHPLRSIPVLAAIAAALLVLATLGHAANAGLLVRERA